MSEPQNELLMARGGRDIPVKVYLTADEYLALEALVDRRGEDSQSGFFRRLFKQEVRREMEPLSGVAASGESATLGPQKA